jgi:hypothetical protein
MTPSGASQMSPGIRQPYVAEQTVCWLFGSFPAAYVGLPPFWIVAGGKLGIFPAETAAFSASVHACGMPAAGAGVPGGWFGNVAVHAEAKVKLCSALAEAHLPGEPTVGVAPPSRRKSPCDGWSRSWYHLAGS